MKSWKNILLAALTLLMLAGFAWAVVSPAVTEDARDRHMNLTMPGGADDGEPADDMYDFL